MQSTSGTINASYTYDGDGNLTAGAGRTIAYSSFNMPVSITQGTNTITFAHDPDHQRFKQVAPEGTTLYMAGFGILVEKFSGSGGAVQWNQYLYAGGEMVGVHFDYNSGPATTRYFHKDNLGSIATITDESGTVVERDAFDAWGKRRFPNGNDDPTDSITSQTTRGFTGQEELAEVGLVHMNGRVYDPLLGRFTSADPVVGQPYDTQGFNRYAYVDNNPLAFTDPNGYGFFSFLSHIFNPVQVFQDHVAIVRAISSVPYLGQALNVATAAVVTFYTGGCVPCGIGAYSALSSLQAGVTSGDLGEAFKAGAISGAEGLSSYYGGPLLAGVVGGSISSAEGRSFQSGFLPAYFSSLVGPVIGDNGMVVNVITSAAIGGTASVIAGGRFEDGAISGSLNGFVNGAATAAMRYAAGLNNGEPGDASSSQGGSSVRLVKYAQGGPLSDDASVSPSTLRAIFQQAVASGYISQAQADEYFSNSLAMQAADALRLQAAVRGYLGIPENWNVNATTNPGLQFFNPNNQTDNVRIMFGKSPYVRDQINGLYLTPENTYNLPF